MSQELAFRVVVKTESGQILEKDIRHLTEEQLHAKIATTSMTVISIENISKPIIIAQSEPSLDDIFPELPASKHTEQDHQAQSIIEYPPPPPLTRYWESQDQHKVPAGTPASKKFKRVAFVVVALGILAAISVLNMFDMSEKAAEIIPAFGAFQHLACADFNETGRPPTDFKSIGYMPPGSTNSEEISSTKYFEYRSTGMGIIARSRTTMNNCQEGSEWELIWVGNCHWKTSDLSSECRVLTPHFSRLSNSESIGSPATNSETQNNANYNTCTNRIMNNPVYRGSPKDLIKSLIEANCSGFLGN